MTVPASLERRLPLLITALLGAAVAVALGGAYREVRRTALTAAEQRLDGIARQLADLIAAGTAQRLRELRTAAAAPGLRAALQRSGAAAPAADAVRPLLARDSLIAGFELWRADGTLAAVVGRPVRAPPPDDAAALRAAALGPDSAALGPLRLAGDTLLLDMAAPVADGPRLLGYLVERRRAASTPAAVRQIAALIGGEVAIFVGNARGDLWTDFVGPAPPPPLRADTAGHPVQYVRPRGGPQLAAGIRVRGTPWSVVAEFPRERVLAPARHFLAQAAVAGLGLLLAGAVGAWAVSRSITSPLARLTAAAGEVAAGREARVDIARRDELGALAAAFNAMAQEVAAARSGLEQTVAARTADLRAAYAELESFSYSVSHDLRAPLRAIAGYAQILEDDHAPALGPEGRDLVGAVRRAAARMGQLIDDLLAFARLGRQALAPVPLDLAAMARDVADELCRHQPDRTITVAIGALPPARGDRALVEQVLANLLGNAVKFTRGRPEARIEVGARRDGGETVYYVRDNGVGFDPRYADKLFGVFQRLHRPDEFEGTGVGLALVQRIVHRHGGRVWAEGRPDAGATFYFTLMPEAAAPGR